MLTHPQTQANPPTADVYPRPVVIELRGLGKVFHSRKGSSLEALREVDLDVRLGEFVCVVGPSGCGKTTLLNILGNLDVKTTGSVRFAFPPSERPLLSIVFQEQGVFPWMTVLDNAAFGLMARGVGRKQREALAREVLERVGLSRFEHAYPRELSGGMKQRVNLARAFANDPDLLLMDEPFAALDEHTKLIMQDGLLHVWEGSRKTVVFITHAIEEAIRLADRIVVMSARPGRIKTEIPVSIPRPRNVYELQTSPEFLRVRGLVWDALKEEVLALAAREAAGEA
jgi:NitT/TauT family transport system ATP-binding protein